MVGEWFCKGLVVGGSAFLVAVFVYALVRWFRPPSPPEMYLPWRREDEN